MPHHLYNCDYIRYPDDPDKECFCPTPAEARAQARMRCLHQPEEGCECADYEDED